jgi:hypothetical protein
MEDVIERATALQSSFQEYNKKIEESTDRKIGLETPTVSMLADEIRADKVIYNARPDTRSFSTAPPPYEATQRPLRLLSLGKNRRLSFER